MTPLKPPNLLHLNDRLKETLCLKIWNPYRPFGDVIYELSLLGDLIVVCLPQLTILWDFFLIEIFLFFSFVNFSGHKVSHNLDRSVICPWELNCYDHFEIFNPRLINRRYIIVNPFCLSKTWKQNEWCTCRYLNPNKAF